MCQQFDTQVPIYKIPPRNLHITWMCVHAFVWGGFGDTRIISGKWCVYVCVCVNACTHVFRQFFFGGAGLRMIVWWVQVLLSVSQQSFMTSHKCFLRCKSYKKAVYWSMNIYLHANIWSFSVYNSSSVEKELLKSIRDFKCIYLHFSFDTKLWLWSQTSYC